MTFTLVPILQLLGKHEAEIPTAPAATPLTVAPALEPLTVAIEGRVEIANGTACDVLGLSEAELLGRRLPEAPDVVWRWSNSRDGSGRLVGAVGWGERVRARLVAASAAPGNG